jgi:hypothetical protein
MYQLTMLETYGTFFDIFADYCFELKLHSEGPYCSWMKQTYMKIFDACSEDGIDCFRMTTCRIAWSGVP